MFGDTSDLAENKLLLLYIFDKIKYPISNAQITQIILENSFINYFTLHQYISELLTANFLEYTTENSKQRLFITEKGSKVLSMFQGRLSKGKLEIIDNYLKIHLENIKKEITVTADYTIENKSNYIVSLRAVENGNLLIDLKLNLPSNKQARDLCSKWKNSSSELYDKIIKLLID